MMGTERREAYVRPAIHSPDRRSRPEAAGLRVGLALAGGVQRGGAVRARKMIRWIIFTEQRAGRPWHEVALY